VIKIAVILFPGTNCEEETARAIESVGMEAEIIRWNSRKDLSEYNGYVIPGGWSYEDRVRAGVISAKDPIIESIRFESTKGKPVLGICNGAQVLVESGLIPGLKGKVTMALAPNINKFVSGFYCTWVELLTCCTSRNAFNIHLDEGDVLEIPIAHAEGRFVTKDKDLVNELVENDQIMFRYSDTKGELENVNPNGSVYNIAGICNKKRNILAMMPHPERACWMKQMRVRGGKFEEAGPGRAIFESMKSYIEEKNEK